jgi:biopolymer transport protein ExbB
VVLIRLHVGDFAFDSAREDGADLRFVDASGKALPFHVERYDSLLGEALLWVGFQDLRPGGQTDVWLYWKNPKATPAEDARATFDRAAVLAYHFAERDQPPRDSTPNGNHASTAGIGLEGALVGRGLRLDGSTAVTIPPSPSLTWAEGSAMTWSAWVRPAADGSTGVVFSRREGPRWLSIGLEGGKPYVEVGGPKGPTRLTATAPIAGGGWSHLAVTTGEVTTLWVDGAPAGKLPARLPALATAAFVGIDPARRAGTTPGAAPGFQGDLDELRIDAVERPPGHLRLSAISQASDPGRLLALGEEEFRRGWGSGSGTLAVIVRSVTFDGWVVIALLAVMAAVSWMVMVEKAAHLRAVGRANARFLERYRGSGADLRRLLSTTDGASPLGEEADLADAPLHRVFRAGAAEIGRQLTGGSSLGPEAMASVRAALETVLADESEVLYRRMVLLTIAISGGPFLGLLGTVVGVMITFAAIAAAGDVNVTAIAPGIAAALVATVAGLAVAIPALFGYNALLTRIKTLHRGMQVFSDELASKAGAAYAARAAPPPLARLVTRGQGAESIS